MSQTRKTAEVILKDHGLVLSCGYEGREEYLYPDQAWICKCCKGYFHCEYYNACTECGNNVVCFTCADGGNECKNFEDSEEDSEENSEDLDH